MAQSLSSLKAAVPRTRKFSADAAFGAIGVSLLLMWGTLELALWDAEKNSLGEENEVPWGWVQGRSASLRDCASRSP